jgi:hypothetical protein
VSFSTTYDSRSPRIRFAPHISRRKTTNTFSASENTGTQLLAQLCATIINQPKCQIGKLPMHLLQQKREEGYGMFRGRERKKETVHITNSINRFSRSPASGPASQNDLFSSYNRSASPSKDKKKPFSAPPRSPYANAGGSPGFGGPGAGYGGNSASAYPGYGVGGGGRDGGGMNGGGAAGEGYRSATPNSRGQYSAQALDELESQNEDQFGALTGKVKMLKDVCISIYLSLLPFLMNSPPPPPSSSSLFLLLIYLTNPNICS